MQRPLHKDTHRELLRRREESLDGFLIYIFLSSSLVNVLSLSLIFIVQVQKCNCCNVSFTACLTSVIFQQYSNGFNEEFKYTKVAVNSLAR